MTNDLTALRAEIEQLRESNRGDVSPGIPLERRRGMDLAYEQILDLLAGLPSSDPPKTDDIEDRISSLAEAGWVLVHSRNERVEGVPGQDDLSHRTPGLVRFERTWRGRAHSVAAESLEAAVTATELEQERISKLDNRPTPTTEGLTAR